MWYFEEGGLWYYVLTQVYFDPHALYLPNVNAANPGKRIEFTAASQQSLLLNYADQFAPLRDVFGCDLKNPYEGTLFRLPLRTPAQVCEGV